jgi:hypothetical protein
MLSAVTWSLAFAMGVVPRPAPLTAHAVLESPLRHVRTESPTLRSYLRMGFEQSPTFAALLARLERGDVIVYIEEVPRLPGALEGRMVMPPPAHGVRYLRIQVAQRGSSADTVALLGHELRHAVEVADASSVIDNAGLAALYRRIGVEHGNNLFDTAEAQEDGRRVLKDLIA